MTWISTGACPYGRRCPSIHDPSITGPLENPSWLPAASAKTNAQIIVDRFAAHRDSAVHQENPMIVQGIWENCRPSVARGNKQQQGGDVNEDVGWDCREDTYAVVCFPGVASTSNVFASRAAKSSEPSPNQGFLVSRSEFDLITRTF